TVQWTIRVFLGNAGPGDMVRASDIESWLLVLHMACGTIALLVAPLAMIAHKGGNWHRRCGKVFFYGMVGICSTAIILGILKPDRFWLALVAVFSFHLVASGYRSL